MKLSRITAAMRIVVTLLMVLCTPVAGQAQANSDQLQSLRAALSLISSGFTDSLGPALQLNPDGAAFHIHIVLQQLAAPPDAAIEASASQLPNGVWQIEPITLPPYATLFRQPEPAANAPLISFGYSIARQSGRARIDPTLASPSTYQMALDGVVFHASAARPGDRLTLAHVAVDGTITGAGGDLIDRQSHLTSNDLHFAGHDNAGMPVTIAVGGFAATYGVQGYDRAKAAHLRRVMAEIAASHPAPPPVTPPAAGRPTPLSPLMRRQLRAVIDGSAGLFSSFNVDEAFHRFHVTLPQGSVDLGQIHIAMAGDGSHGRIAARVDFGLDDLALPAASPQVRPLLPHHVAVRAAASGLQPDAVRAFLRGAVSASADPVLLRARAITLLDEPGARAGIESLSADFGPMQIHGSARVRPLPDGTAALDLHLVATGVDALLQALQSDPSTSRAIPMLLMAKGLGRPEGNRTVWDIALSQRGATVNGIALAPHGRASAPPSAPMRR